ncbi:MAG TPA: hypothetical protein VIM30_11385 [Candidatus Limnocylindrales bacterium]|jgi:hypothetical protein
MPSGYGSEPLRPRRGDEPIALDPLTVVDDTDYLDTLSKERNLPPGLAQTIGQLS